MKKIKLSNTFEVIASVGYPNKTENNRWLMKRLYGKEKIPIHIHLPDDERKEAFYRLHRGKEVLLKFEILTDGNWKLLSAKII